MFLRSSDLGDFPEDDDDEENIEDELLITNSPEPPEPVEPDDANQMDESGQPGRLHPEQDLPHIFKVCAFELVFSVWLCVSFSLFVSCLLINS